MATEVELAELRLLIAEPDETTYTDEMLSVVFDSAETMNHAALEIWTQKAARFAELVDISEGGSQRKNSDLQKNAVTMMSVFQSRIDIATLGAGRTKIARLAR